MHVCGVRSDGSIVCWKRDNALQVSAPGDSFAQVSAGWAHSCGLRSDGSVECEGDNSDGQAEAPGDSFAQVSAGEEHTCGLRSRWFGCVLG